MYHKATIVSDFGFGDAGKGSLVDFLAREQPRATVIRFNGGSQAAHNVVTPGGIHHTFAQFGSGTFVPGVDTHLSRFMLIDPYALVREAEHLVSLGINDVWSRLSIDEGVKVITPFQQAANRIREKARGHNNHGSCGMGVGETMADSIMLPHLTVHVRDLLGDRTSLYNKLASMQEHKRTELASQLYMLRDDAELAREIQLLSHSDAVYTITEELQQFARRVRIVPGTYLSTLSLKGSLIFEGAQGVLLDEWYGFHPYTTWSTTTFHNALTLLEEIGYGGQIEKIGMLRAYHTRHGPGPFVTEDPRMTQTLPDLHNGFGRWQGGFRVGPFDAVMARYAAAVSGGADILAITHLDRLPEHDRYVAVGYDVPKSVARRADHMIRSYGEVPSSILTRVTALAPKTDLEDLVYQERLTALLDTATPVYSPVSGNDQLFLDRVAQEVQVPVGIVSYGPTAREKWRVSSLARAA